MTNDRHQPGCLGCSSVLVSTLARDLRRNLPEATGDLDDAALDRRIQVAVTTAMAWGLTLPASIAEYVLLSFALGPAFTRRFRIRDHLSRRQTPRDESILTLRSFSHPNCWLRPEPNVLEQEWRELLSDDKFLEHPEIVAVVEGDLCPEVSLPHPAFSLDVHFSETPVDVVHTMLEVARVERADTVMDLGSGDGRIVIAAARRYGCHGIGVDLSWENVEKGRRAAEAADVSHLVKFVRADLHDVDLSEASVVTLFLLNHVNMAIRERLRCELRPGSRVVSRGFSMGDWTPDVQVGGLNEAIYCWTIR